MIGSAMHGITIIIIHTIPPGISVLISSFHINVAEEPAIGNSNGLPFSVNSHRSLFGNIDKQVLAPVKLSIIVINRIRRSNHGSIRTDHIQTDHIAFSCPLHIPVPVEVYKLSIDISLPVIGAQFIKVNCFPAGFGIHNQFTVTEAPVPFIVVFSPPVFTVIPVQDPDDGRPVFIPNLHP